MSVGVLLLCVARMALAQCPDGTPPPCAGARPPDPHRIAILPFRVTTADTLLGEGIPELLAAEFAGQDGPRSVHMGTVLRAWRKAGGALRRPLTRDAMLRVAREIDAGLLVDGSIVRLGSRLTLSASLVTVASRRAVRRVERVSGPLDSLEWLVGRLASGLVAATGGERGTDVTTLTSSPAAMRAYLEGLSDFRRFRFQEAAGAFERALGMDSSFARAAFMRYQTSTWMEDGGGVWEAMAWQRRDRLPPQDRMVLSARLGDRYPERRTPAENLADRRRAASALPESPEAQVELGDYLFHVGTANGIADGFQQARAAFDRALALDTQVIVLLHLLDIGLYNSDTALLRRVWPTFDRLSSPSLSTAFGMVIAERTGDVALAEAMARRPVPGGASVLRLAVEAGLPADAVGRLYDRLAPAVDPGLRRTLEGQRAVTLVIAGRPSALVALRDRTGDPGGARVIDLRIVAAWLHADGDSSAAAAAATRLAAATAPDSDAQAATVCVRAQWQLRIGEAPQFDPSQLQRHRRRLCAAALMALLAWQTGEIGRAHV